MTDTDTDTDFDFDTIVSKFTAKNTPVRVGNVLYLASTVREEHCIAGYTAGKVFEVLKLKDGSTHRAYTYRARAYTRIFLQYIETYVDKEDQRELYTALTKCPVVAHKNAKALNAPLAHKIMQKFPCCYTHNALLEAYAHSKQWAPYYVAGGLSFYDGKDVIVFKTLKDVLNGKKKKLPANEIADDLLAKAKKRFLHRGYATPEVKILSLRAYSTMKILKELHAEGVESCMLSGKKYARYATIWRNFYYRNGFKVAIFYYDQKPVGRMLVYDREGVKAFIEKPYGICRPALLKALGYDGERALERQKASFKRINGATALASAPYSDPLGGIFSYIDTDTKRIYARWGSENGDFDFEARSLEGRITIALTECCACGSSVDANHVQPSEGAVYCEDCYREVFISCYACEDDIHREDAVETAILYSNGHYDIEPCCSGCAEGGSRRYSAIHALQE